MGLSVPGCWPHIVVLLAEDVDRNPPALQGLDAEQMSSSSRRTWIEML